MIEASVGTAPGEAVLRFEGAAATEPSPAFRIERDKEWAAHTLGPSGWQTADALLQPRRAEVSGPDLLLHVGWEVCQYLEGGVYLISLPAAGLGPSGVYWPDIAPSVAASVLPEPVLPEPVTKAAPIVDAILTQPSEPVRLLPPATLIFDPRLPAPRSLLLPLLGLLLLLALAGAGAWFWLNRFALETPVIVPSSRPVTLTPPVNPPPAAAAEPVLPPPAPPPPPAPTDLTRLSVPDVLAQAPNLGAVVTEGQRRLGSTQKDDGLLLLEAASDNRDCHATAAIARLYDPVLFQPGGPIPRPDPRQAARYYRDAARLGQDVARVREALRQWLQAHDSMANDLVLRDFLP